jgi:hypothetical protein
MHRFELKTVTILLGFANTYYIRNLLSKLCFQNMAMTFIADWREHELWIAHMVFICLFKEIMTYVLQNILSLIPL